MGRYTIHVVGESFMNLDGSSRQDELARCRVGEAVALERDPYNPHDPNCVKVISARGVQVGNIGRENAEWIGQRIDKGGFVAATIESIGMGERGLLGAVLSVSTDEFPEAAPVASAAAAAPAGRVKWRELAKVGIGMLVVMGIASLFMGEPGPPRAAPRQESANPEYYAEAAISLAHMRCGGVTIAERLASGTVVAECRDGQRYRIFEVGGGGVSVERCPSDGRCE